MARIFETVSGRPCFSAWGSFKLLLPFLCSSFTSCTSAPLSPPPQTAFFHWTTRLSLTQADRALLDSLGVRRLYVRFFDVDWEEGQGAVPLATLEPDTASALPESLEVVPAVFITNRTMQRLEANEAGALARRIDERLFFLAGKLPGIAVREVQIDCDWTETTRERYFGLLDALKPLLAARGAKLSATIRLHQFRYVSRTGVPPVDRGLLMCYNTGEVGEWAEENSILRPAAVRPYLDPGGGRYPLELDLALPAFAWGVVFRDGRLVRLIHGLRPADLRDPQRFTQLAPNRFEVLKSTYLKGYYLYGGDRLRTEAADPAALLETVRVLGPVFRGKKYTIAFYHLGGGYGAEELRGVLK